MDNAIGELIEMDKKARAMVDEANDYLSNTLNNMDRDVAEFRAGYKEKAMKRIGVIREQEGKLSEEALRDMAGRYDALMQNLEKSYENNHKQWEDELFYKVLGR